MLRSIGELEGRAWDSLFAAETENADYLRAVETAGMAEFQWRYLIVEDAGRVIAAAPAFLTDYALDTTLVGAGRRIVGGLRRRFPRALTMRLACIGSPCTETAQLGFDPRLDRNGRAAALRLLVKEFERAAAAEGCRLLAVKDVAAAQRPLCDQVLEPLGYRSLAGLPVAYLEIDFRSIEDYLGRLSPGTRRDMRRKLRMLEHVRIEIRAGLHGVLDRVMSLYAQTRARAAMQFETLPPAYFTAVTE
ncbi:MAG TPA: hypothetical protein VMH77_10085, partial [Steroidobacteraceae bacterium]|nr:hypothetical protein [Steroidobacteraceae bacterium]